MKILNPQEESAVRALQFQMFHRQIAKLFGVSRSTITRTMTPKMRLKQKLQQVLGKAA